MAYTTGTIALTHGSDAVNGSGTSWAGVVAVGDRLVGPDGRTYSVAAVGGPSSLTLTSPYLGATVTGAAYAVFSMPSIPEPGVGSSHWLRLRSTDEIMSDGQALGEVTLETNDSSNPAMDAGRLLWKASGTIGYTDLTVQRRNAASGALRDALVVRANGDVDFLAEDGTTTALEWDASIGALRIGGSSAPIVVSGAGTPEGVVSAPVGSLYLRSDDGGVFYKKATGSGNTGWVGSGLSYGVLKEISTFMAASVTDHRAASLPNAMRRSVKFIRDVGGTDVVDVVAEKSFNTTGAGYCLRYLALLADKYPESPRDQALMLRLADLILSMQCKNPRLARYGGFALATSDRVASAYNAAMCGLGLLAAYRVTKDPRYLRSCNMAAEFLGVLNSPNARYQALYGVTPIPALAGNTGFNGFCDQISAGDTILTTHSTWNLLASKFLAELAAVTGDAGQLALAEDTRDWGATGVTGFWDFFTIEHSGALPSNVSNNWFATGLTVSDGQWHRRGECVISTTQRTSTITGATSTTITLDAGASAVDDAYNGMAVTMTTGAAAAKGSLIIDYDGTTKVATLRFPFPALPGGGDTYRIGWGVNTIGSDQMEYGLESLLDTGYDLDAVKLAYATICSWPNADGGAFGTAYNSQICWTGYFRPFSPHYGGASRAYGTQYDVQGIGPLLRLKKLHYPTHFAVSMEKALLISSVATLVDKDWQTIWSTGENGLTEYATVGVGTVKGAIGVGILEAI